MPGHLEQQGQAVIDGIRGSDAVLAWLRARPPVAQQHEKSEAVADAPIRTFGELHESAIRTHREASLDFAHLLRELAASYRQDAGEFALMCADFGDERFGQKALQYSEWAENWEKKAEEIFQSHQH